MRIGIIINPSSDTDNVDSTMDINKIALAAINVLPVEKAMHFVRNIIKEDTVTDIVNGKFDMQVIF